MNSDSDCSRFSPGLRRVATEALVEFCDLWDALQRPSRRGKAFAKPIRWWRREVAKNQSLICRQMTLPLAQPAAELPQDQQRELTLRWSTSCCTLPSPQRRRGERRERNEFKAQ